MAENTEDQRDYFICLKSPTGRFQTSDPNLKYCLCPPAATADWAGWAPSLFPYLARLCRMETLGWPVSAQLVAGDCQGQRRSKKGHTRPVFVFSLVSIKYGLPADSSE
jgi:hypothetical protein